MERCGSARAQCPRPRGQAIRELERREIPLLAATARRSWSAAHYLRQADLDLPAVLLNGALGRDKGGEPIFHQCTFEPDDALAVLDIFERHGVTPGANFESREWDVVSGRLRARASPTSCGRGRSCGWWTTCGPWWPPCPSTPSPWSPARKRRRSGPCATTWRRPAVSGWSIVFPDKVFGGWTLDSAPKGVNKWSGVEAYCRYRDLDPGAVLAIGDGDNDVELFERAAHSCAMSHATERAKAAAHVTLSGGMDGWAQLLDYL